MATTTERFRCMACGHEYAETLEKGVDRERQCPRCRSNSVRLPKRPPAAEPAARGEAS
jgi:DNA-directed RNA polymerase subunit RPC12/RpoP